MQQTTLGGPDNHAHNQRWNSLEVTRGSFGPEDFTPDIVEVKFDRPVPIKVGCLRDDSNVVTEKLIYRKMSNTPFVLEITEEEQIMVTVV